MKNLILLLFLLTSSIFIYAQPPKKVIKRNNFTREIINPKSIYSNLYHVETGKKMTKKDFKSLLKEKKRVKFIPFYDKYGKPEKYFYNPNQDNKRRNSFNKKPEIGKKFPDFVVTTYKREQIALEKLKGKLVIIHFALLKDKTWANRKAFNEINTKINSSKRASEIESLILFNTTTGEQDKQIAKKFYKDESNFKLITKSAKGFYCKWEIGKLPTTFIINKDGDLIGNLNPEEINLEALLK